MLADIDFVDDTSPLYTVRWAWPLKNDTIQLYTYAGRSSSDILDSSVECREIEGYDNDIRVGLEQAGDGVEKGNDGSRRGTSGTESKLI